MGDTSPKGQAPIVRLRAFNEEKFRSRRTKIVISRKVFPPMGFAWSRRFLRVKICEVWAQFEDENLLTIKYQPKLSAGMWVSIGDRHYEITSIVDRLGKTRRLDLHIKVITPGVGGLPDAHDEE